MPDSNIGTCSKCCDGGNKHQTDMLCFRGTPWRWSANSDMKDVGAGG